MLAVGVLGGFRGIRREIRIRLGGGERGRMGVKGGEWRILLFGRGGVSGWGEGVIGMMSVWVGYWKVG